MTIPFKAFVRPDAMLRKYAHFEDPAPAPDSAPPTLPAPTPVTFTAEQQAAIDKLIGKARTEGKESATTALLKKVGAEKPEDVEAWGKAVREADEAKKTEAEKLISEKLRADNAIAELKTFQEKVEAEKRAATRDSAISKALTTANAKAEKVLKLLKVDQAESLAAVLKEDGSVDETKVKALVETARKLYPEDFRVGGIGSPSNGDGRVPEPGGKDRQTAAQATFNQLRGRL